MALQQRAFGDGLMEEKVEIAMKTDRPKEALIELIVQEACTSGTLVEAGK